MAQLSPLSVGDSPEEDQVRLSTLLRAAEVRSRLPVASRRGAHGGRTEQAVQAHQEALKTIGLLGKKEQAALREVRLLRPAAQAIGGDFLDSRSGANVPMEQQVTFGRERRRRPRPPATPKTERKAA